MDVVERFKEKIKKALAAFEQEVKGVRAGRPSTALIEDLEVEHYGAQTPLKHLSSIGVVPPREIHIQVWDEEAVRAVADAIESSDLGLTPNVEGNVIKLYLPELSKERKEELIKYVKKLAEDHRIQVRHFRDEANKTVDALFEKKEISEDDKFRLKEEVQKETERANKEFELIVERKEREIKQ